VQPVSLERARAAKPAALRVFRELGTVTGVGIARVGNGWGLKVNLEAPLAGGATPDTVEGVPVVTAVTGKIRKR
jgi:hypothetical protein